MAIRLRDIQEKDLKMIMEWRMSASVTKYMNTDPVLTLDGQRRWLSAINAGEISRHWLIEVDGESVGLICLLQTDWKRKTTSWGYYIGEKRNRSLKLAISLEMSLYDYCFGVLDLQEVTSETFKENEGVWKLHLACGCQIIDEISNEVEKNGQSFDVVHMSMIKDVWLALREKKKYERIKFGGFQRRNR